MTASSSIFSSLNILVIETSSTGEDETESLIALLKRNGAVETMRYHATTDIEMTKQEFLDRFPMHIHCVVSKDIHFPFYRLAAFDFLIPIVTPSWVDACIQNSRLMRTTGYSPDSEHILKNCYIYLARQSLSISEYQLYISLILYMGGCCMEFLSTKVTHIITIDPNDPATLAALKVDNVNISSVVPSWLINCFINGKQLPEGNYTLNTDMTKEEAVELFEESCKVEKEHWTWSFDFLKDHRMYLSMNLALKSKCYKFLIQFIEAMGGKVVRYIDHQEFSIDSADCFLDSDTSSKDYMSAKSLGLYCGNVNWLFYMLSMRSFVRPTTKLLLSPTKPKIFTRKELILTYTNYLGQQRTYIQRLVEAVGGVATTELSKKNTHLISLFAQGRKFETARKWATCVVTNHMWLEKCYKTGEKLDVNLPEFAQIPIPGGTANYMGQLALEEPHIIYTVEEQTEPNFTLTPNAPEAIVANTDFITDTPVIEEPTQQGDSMALEADDKDKENVISTIDKPKKTSKELSPEVQGSQQDQDSTGGGPKSSAISPSAEKELLPKIRQPNSYASQLELWDADSLPSPSSSGRKAKAKAAEKLHSDMESLNEFVKSSRKKRTADLLPEELETLKKRKNLAADAQKLLLQVQVPKPSKGRGKLPYDIKAVCTNCGDDINQLDKEILRQLGVEIQSEISSNTNCIIASKKARTAKFLTSFSCRPLKYALTPSFLNDLLSIVHAGLGGNVLLNLDKYHIQDVDQEILKKTHSHAKLFEKSLLSVNLSDDVPGGAEVLAPILKAHGITNVSGLPKKFEFKDIVPNKLDKQYQSPDYMLIANKASVAKKFAKLCKEHDSKSKVLIVEWNWCVKAIFSLNVDYTDPEFVIINK
ncbi:HBL270Cp [Eremothecium sinecaudum]|uniref:HBL270Cp n=1 Tax=Eremothecium sinecaudum TaxID=45286 RepID=A0A120K0S5_9SACH|nr:HBL270Cp [Eremothecium sinecaudum]AMD18632.1 HBL270Cp [Eremothecium sinecaudum]